MRVLLVEDDRMIGQAVEGSLKDARYTVDWVRDGKAALDSLASQPYDVVLLDLGLPQKDGLQVLASLRSRGLGVPVLILTARDDLESRLQGLDNGADDYIIKPFDMSEVLARIRAVLRRHGGSAINQLNSGTLQLDPSTYHVKRLDTGETIFLSNREFAILHALMQRPGTIFSRADLEDKVYGWGEEPESNAVDYLIHALRKKLGHDSIKNVRGVGWLVPKKAD
ncbi:MULTISPECIES: response regulator transcription factor [unclassified Neisseria]|uniref:response regulator transcription factor n=1 Tax=unclassified Neisseria TaxID=2623750 RepID=UPI002665F3F3|nr:MULTISPECIES: response regulator transcription factor [unclassified Neisseria]MDO1510670.1 response regulator transcription factor [Neisseria sp. MVDL19-042950]MDO1516960.1 response regulator transcription factor [Neisseria sp. MVDL18-041461]MDO1564322.1 response regulator transcription factor [Neisseria sp. MVDL20-010259]